MPNPPRSPRGRPAGGRPAAFLSESNFQGHVLTLAKLHRWQYYHPHDSRRSNPGWPDLCFWRDRVFFAELKTEQGVVSEDQLRVIVGLRDAGATCFIWRPGDWNEIVATLGMKERP